MNRIIFCFFVFFAAILFSLVNQPASAQGIAPDSIDIEYAKIDTISLKLDVYLPKNVTPPYPVIVWIHGGAWLAGSKENARAAFMVNFGYAVVSINYRLSQQAIFPAQIYDCKAAVRWIRAHASEYNFDPDRIGAWGLSAGGHLSALLGTAADVDSLEGDVGGNAQFSSEVQAVCDWYGPSNLPTVVDYPSDLDWVSPDSPGGRLIGCAIPDCPDKARAASPITYLSGDEPPFLIMHGTEDLTVPFHQSVELDSALREVGVEVQFIPKEDTGHGGGLFADASTNQEVLVFFEIYLKSPATSINREPTGIQSFTLEQNYPNPFNPSTTISYSLKDAGEVELKIYDMLGRVVRALVSETRLAGQYSVVWDGRDDLGNQVASGLYVYTLVAGEFQSTRRMVFLK